VTPAIVTEKGPKLFTYYASVIVYVKLKLVKPLLTVVAESQEFIVCDLKR
jgi:hypothetical protein